jgi:hypothetical protein
VPNGLKLNNTEDLLMAKLEKVAYFRGTPKAQTNPYEQLNEQQRRMFQHYQRNKAELDNYSAVPWVTGIATAIPTYKGAMTLLRKYGPKMLPKSLRIYSSIIALGASILGGKAANKLTGRKKLIEENKQLMNQMERTNKVMQFNNQYNNMSGRGSQWNPLLPSDVPLINPRQYPLEPYTED